jgi:holliday junction DNA helicase RuvA
LAIGGTGEAAKPTANEDVLNALIGLGYSDKEAIIAVKQLPADVTVSDGIRMALKALSKS